jgi:hypothetical protein
MRTLLWKFYAVEEPDTGFAKASVDGFKIAAVVSFRLE